MQALDTAPQVSFSPLLRSYTLEEFWALPDPDDRSHYELIGGFLFMVPPPHPPHGSIDSRLSRSLLQYLLAHHDVGEVHHPREAIYTDLLGGTYLEPDMMYVCRNWANVWGERTSADIVFEYISASNAFTIARRKRIRILPWCAHYGWWILYLTVEVRYATERGQACRETWRYSRDWRVQIWRVAGSVRTL